MKLAKLKKAVKQLVTKVSKGNTVKRKKIVKVLDNLKEKRKQINKLIDREQSKKARKDLNLKLKVVRAQIKKAHRLLKELED